MSIQKGTFFLMFRRDAYTNLGQLLNQKLRYVCNDKSILALDALSDIYALAMQNIELSRERQADKFLMYPMPNYNVQNKMLVSNHRRDVQDLKYDVTYSVVQVIGGQLELMHVRENLAGLMSKMSRACNWSMN